MASGKRIADNLSDDDFERATKTTPVGLYEALPSMSALGQKRTSGEQATMSALLPKADIRAGPSYVSAHQLRQLRHVGRNAPASSVQGIEARRQALYLCGH